MKKTNLFAAFADSAEKILTEAAPALEGLEATLETVEKSAGEQRGEWSKRIAAAEAMIEEAELEAQKALSTGNVKLSADAHRKREEAGKELAFCEECLERLKSLPAFSEEDEAKLKSAVIAETDGWLIRYAGVIGEAFLALQKMAMDCQRREDRVEAALRKLRKVQLKPEAVTLEYPINSRGGKAPGVEAAGLVFTLAQSQPGLILTQIGKAAEAQEETK